MEPEGSRVAPKTRVAGVFAVGERPREGRVAEHPIGTFDELVDPVVPEVAHRARIEGTKMLGDLNGDVGVVPAAAIGVEDAGVLHQRGNDAAGLLPAVIRVEAAELACPHHCLLYTSPSPRDRTRSRMPSSA